jgi:hypothetical protein
MLGLAHDLEVKLPGTKAAFLAGTLDRARAEIVAWAVAGLTPEEARGGSPRRCPAGSVTGARHVH